MAIDLNVKGDASTRGWGPGWPTDRRKDMAKVISGGISVWVHHGIAPLVAWLLDETSNRGYQLYPGQCWGFASRPIRGSNKPSNHSFGLALDLNAPGNPMSDHLVTDMPAWLPDLWNKWGFRWGGDYRGRKDAMHLEFSGTPADATSLIAELQKPVLPSRQTPVVIPGGPMPTKVQRRPVVLMVHPSGAGYWQVTEDGGIFAFGGIPFYGSLGDKALNSPVVSGDVTPTGNGYWLCAADGGIFAFGDAGFFGSMGGRQLNKPVVDMRRSSSGAGYALMAEDGGLFCFGDFPYRDNVLFDG